MKTFLYEMTDFYMECIADWSNGWFLYEMNGGLKWVNLMRMGLTIVFLAKNRSCLWYGCSDWV